jgi:hypothetical protein
MGIDIGDEFSKIGDRQVRICHQHGRRRSGETHGFKAAERIIGQLLE